MTPENKPESQASKDPRQIEAAISDTRGALSDDIKALSDKTSAAHLKQEAKQAVKNAKDSLVDKAVEVSAEAKDRALEIKDIAVEKASEVKDLAVTKAQDASDAIADTAEEVAMQTREAGRVAWRFTVTNAVPLSLIGLGAGLLISNQRKTQRLSDWDDEQNYYDDPDDYRSDNFAFAADADSPVRVRPAARARPKRKAPSALKQAGSRLRQDSKRVYDKTSEGIEQAEHTLADTAARGREVVQDRFRSVQRASRDFVDANPLALAFGTLLAGVGVGLLLPTSSREDALLRPARARIRGAVGDARRLAEDVSDVAKQTVRDVGRSASDM